MLRSMYSGISGMKNFQTKLDVIGNNIANVNTYGYKKGRVTFKDTMNQTISGASAAQDNRGGRNPMQVGLGSTIASIDTIHTQSSLQTTGRSLDLAISGDGYFVVKQGNVQAYTRAGNFYLDDNGTLVNSDGMKVQQYENGVLKDIVVNVNATLPSVPTSNLKLAGSLPDPAGLTNGTSGAVQQMKIVDNNGIEHVLDVQYSPNTGNTGWQLTITNQTADPSLTTNPVTINLPYNSTDDEFTTPSTLNLTDLGISDGNTAVQLNVEDLKLDGDSITGLVNPDGNLEGALESFNIGSLGEVNGVYSNGQIRTLGSLALAKFSNPSGLSKMGGNSFQESVNSGTANINVAGQGRGTLAAGSLEMSNVDLSEEFTEMITAQRGFQANTRIITTSDEILQELVNLKR
ncbi:flagellar hook-basal body complex protein [Rossellomorea aquimaris]|uniref:flagellar hook protein FlgE n=1 Tax=Rossellomorea aquimaris TaxID=189382 RepID=UPI001CD417C5|nr:flagellar hook-basal body complex protein [Rossellomorea aquimaris]MCA1053517.1 flagellar hook-basal body complex protein [Rossellomorea aquimaris]